MKLIASNGVARLARLSDGTLVVCIPGVGELYRGRSLADAYAVYRDAAD